ncbi:hypothetical protein [Siphonobacter curvatus]|uniref:Uncharacterized protein n=1 Tax=Siphonobacter curvatus TaxID=2094562 RepID=A0A2S7IJD3_9BACT|nr:hypothetical protein [Siphonobacter curvatus]PQA56750.1 hypothetical protein C5O19_15525 [Siphonobacter curvatus]
MALVIFPFLVLISFVVIYSIIESLKIIKTNKISEKNLAVALFISLGLYIVIIISYWGESRTWIFNPYFKIPTLVILVPFIIKSILNKSKNISLVALTDTLTVSIALNGIIGILFPSISFEILDFMSIEKYY